LRGHSRVAPRSVASTADNPREPFSRFPEYHFCREGSGRLQSAIKRRRRDRRTKCWASDASRPHASRQRFGPATIRNSSQGSPRLFATLIITLHVAHALLRAVSGLISTLPAQARVAHAREVPEGAANASVLSRATSSSCVPHLATIAIRSPASQWRLLRTQSAL
jgi:hypothetical protein